MAHLAQRILIGLGGAVVVLGVAVGLRLTVLAPKPPPAFDTAKVARGHLVARVTATGTLSALVTVQVGAQVSGRVSALMADFNSEVKKGDHIAQLDPELFEAAVAQARANHTQAIGQLAKARAVAKNAKIQLDRANELNKNGLISAQDLDTARANLDSASADIIAQGGNVEQAKAQLDAAIVNLKYTKIVSPVDGTVISRSVDVGQTVAASLQAPVLFIIAEDLRKMQVDTSVAEGDVGKLEAGSTATFVVDAFPNDRFTGKVRQIRNSATNVQNVVTYDAVLDVVNTDLRLRPGMTANVTFVYAEKDDVLEVPNAALRFRPSPELVASLTESADGEHKHHKKGARAAASAEPADAEGAPNPSAKPEPDKRAVWVLRGGAVKRVAIRTGVTDGTASEVVEGALVVGDEVIIDTLTGAKPASATTAGGGRGMPRMF